MEKLIIDATYSSDKYSYEEYKKYCSYMEMDVYSENSDEYYAWQTDQILNSINDFFDKLEEKDLSDKKVGISGKLGLWDKNHKIPPRTFKNFKEAYNAMLNCSDSFKLYSVNGVLKLEGYHHDGTNVFYIKFLDSDNKQIDL